MDKNESAVFSCIGLLILVVVSVVGAALMNGWVLSIFWGWFVVPVFNVPQISIPLAIGLSLTVGMLCGSKSLFRMAKRNRSAKLLHKLLQPLFFPPYLFFLLGGS